MRFGKFCFASFGTRSLNISASFASAPAREPMRIVSEVISEET